MATHSSILAWRIPWTESLVGYSPWGHKESGVSERLHFHLFFMLAWGGDLFFWPKQPSLSFSPKTLSRDQS